jgi:hypothetical protein
MKTLFLAILFGMLLCAAPKDTPIVTVEYRNAEGCAALESLGVPGFANCEQMVQVFVTSADLTVENVAIAISYTDQNGRHQIQTQPPVATNENDGFAVASVAFFGVDDITDLTATVMDDHGRIQTAGL